MPQIDLPALFQAIASLAYQIILALVPILLAILLPQFKAWLVAKVAEMRAQMNDQQRYLVDEGIRIAVQAAEQLKLRDAIGDKKEWALHFAKEWLSSRGLDLDVFQLEGMIEAEVFRVFGEENKAKAAKAYKPPEL